MNEYHCSPQVTVIEPIIQIPTAATATEDRKLRVAAYARVSTEQDAQQSSYAAQVDYYTKYIAQNPCWEFIGVYSDEGVTGTNTKEACRVQSDDTRRL